MRYAPTPGTRQNSLPPQGLSLTPLNFATVTSKGGSHTILFTSRNKKGIES